ncbi:MAG: HIRAN domain-containing protein [Treponema sp.]|nr:HIRAN domain-containing protein [Treponema sp.]
MSLGNRLATKGNDRSIAFVRAWAIVKAGSLELAVKGTSYGTRQEALRRLAGYNPADVRAFIVPEPDNPADPAAVTVMVGVQGGRGIYRLGYLPREQTAIAAVFKAASLRVLDGNIRGARIALRA